MDPPTALPSLTPDQELLIHTILAEVSSSTLYRAVLGIGIPMVTLGFPAFLRSYGRDAIRLHRRHRTNAQAVQQPDDQDMAQEPDDGLSRSLEYASNLSDHLAHVNHSFLAARERARAQGLVNELRRCVLLISPITYLRNCTGCFHYRHCVMPENAPPMQKGFNLP